MDRNDYTDLDSSARAPRGESGTVKVQPRKISGLSLAAVLVGILAIPAALLPLIGIFVAVIALILGLIAVIRAAKQEKPKTFAGIGLVLGIVSMALAIIITTAAMDAANDCGHLRGVENEQCLKEHA